MASSNQYSLSLLFFFFFFSCTLLIGLAASSFTPTFLSDSVFESHGFAASRSLLQAKKSCSINFESQNYTIITSKCKGPQYPPQACCQAFKEFACPFADAINDAQSDCASTMFSYINLYGKYPPGLFALQCREGKEGLDCTDILAAKEKSRAQITATPSTLLLLLTAFSMLLRHLF
ncbi:GPI-anchored protein LORELEI [Trema orientale]|uniref:GPI-anchored protein LORELEI n=1 Tax=Trema orientale TaxID=63057 RepID=A0A2P5EQI2_TREOI|nr:GPI-anchored protein LORELEI [Trema orientale]